MPTLITASAPAASQALQVNQSLKMTFQLAVTGSGTVSASAVVEGSHDGQGWINISTINASGTSGYGSDGGTFETYYPQIRARITAVSGGSATVYYGA